MGKVLLIHDDPDFLITRSEFYRNHGHEVTECISGQDGLAAIQASNSLGVVIAHKDIDGEKPDGVYIDEIAEALRKKEDLANFGIVSGEFPYGLTHVLNLKADFYFPYTLPPEDNWILGQLNRELVSPEQLEQRGIRVATPMGFKER